MRVAKSKITGNCTTVVPAEVRERLGVGPGSVLEWDFVDDHLVVRRAVRTSSTGIHDALFETPPPARCVAEQDAGIARHVRKKHSRR